MAALDFPSSPTVNQKYPQPPVPGQPVYTWDGEKWTTLGGAIGSTGASDAIPLPDAVNGAAGSSTLWARGDHVHPVGCSITAADDPPLDAKEGALWWESTTGLLYIYYNDGDSLQWVIACPQTDLTTFATLASPVFTGDPKAPTPPAGDSDTSIATTAFVTSSAVRYDVTQSLTATQQQQARANIYAAPFDAMAYSGMQINGGMEVAQSLGWNNPTTSLGYFADCWSSNKTGSMIVSFGTFSNTVVVPGFLTTAIGTVTTAQASLGASDYYVLRTTIEGYRVARLQWGTAGAIPITVAFWSAHHRSGIYSLRIANSDGSRNYTTTYTQTAADVAQYNVITIPGDTAGTWNKGTGLGMLIHFAVACGTTYTAPVANTWSGTLYYAAPGQINGVAATSDVFRITGFFVLPGSEAPKSDRSLYLARPYDSESLLCMRQYELGVAPYMYLGGGLNSSAGYGSLQFIVPKRVQPTTSGNNWQYWSGGGAASVSPTFGSTIYHITFTASGLTNFNGWVGGSWIADARL